MQKKNINLHWFLCWKEEYEDFYTYIVQILSKRKFQMLRKPFCQPQEIAKSPNWFLTRQFPIPFSPVYSRKTYLFLVLMIKPTWNSCIQKLGVRNKREPYFVRHTGLLIDRIAFVRHLILRVGKCSTLRFYWLENVRHFRELERGKISQYIAQAIKLKSL